MKNRRYTNVRTTGGAKNCPNIQAIHNWYSFLKLNERWDLGRIQRLCGYLRIDEMEMCALLNQDFYYLTRSLIKGKPVTGALALLLTILESHVLYGFFEDIPKQVLPTGLFTNGHPKDS